MYYTLTTFIVYIILSFNFGIIMLLSCNLPTGKFDNNMEYKAYIGNLKGGAISCFPANL